MAEIALLLGGILGATVIVGALVAMIRKRGPYARGEVAALRRSQRAAVLRAAVSVLVALAVFGTAVAAHIAFPLWEGLPFAIGPTLGTAAGLTVFALFPAVPIEGKVDRQIASLDRRGWNSIASPGLLWAFLASAVLAIAVVVVCGSISMAAADGRYLCTSLFDGPCTAGGPYLFPGWYFGLPTVAAVVLLVTSVVLAIRRVVASPGSSWLSLVDADHALRENAARLILSIGTTPLVLTIGMFLGAAGIPLLNSPVLDTGLPGAANQTLSVVGLSLVLTAAVMTLVGIAFAIAAVIRGITVGRLARLRIPRSASAAEQMA